MCFREKQSLGWHPTTSEHDNNYQRICSMRVRSTGLNKMTTMRVSVLLRGETERSHRRKRKKTCKKMGTHDNATLWLEASQGCTNGSTQREMQHMQRQPDKHVSRPLCFCDERGAELMSPRRMCTINSSQCRWSAQSTAVHVFHEWWRRWLRRHSMRRRYLDIWFMWWYAWRGCLVLVRDVLDHASIVLRWFEYQLWVQWHRIAALLSATTHTS